MKILRGLVQFYIACITMIFQPRNKAKLQIFYNNHLRFPFSYLETLILRKNNLKKPHKEWFVNLFKNNDMQNLTDIADNLWECNCHAINFEVTTSQYLLIRNNSKRQLLEIKLKITFLNRIF